MYDIVLYGCTGFTGKLAVSYLTATYGDTIKWAVAGRSKERVQKVADILGEGIPDIIIADSGNEKEILKMVKQVREGGGEETGGGRDRRARVAMLLMGWEGGRAFKGVQTGCRATIMER